MLVQQNTHLIEKVKQLTLEKQKLMADAESNKIASEKLSNNYKYIYDIIKKVC